MNGCLDKFVFSYRRKSASSANFARPFPRQHTIGIYTTDRLNSRHCRVRWMRDRVEERGDSVAIDNARACKDGETDIDFVKTQLSLQLAF